MRLRVKVGMLVVVLAFGTLGICAQSAQDQSPQDQSPQNQSPQDQPPPQGQQPTEPAAPTQPDAAPQTQPPQTQSPQTQSPNENQTANPQTPPPATPEAPVLKRRPAHKPVHKKKTTKPQSGKVVVRNGGAKEGSPQLAPGTSKEQELHKRENTNQLLA